MDLQLLIFKNFLDQLTNVPDSEWEELKKILKVGVLSPGDTFIQQGEVASTFAFITKGLVKMIYISKDGQEKIKYFGTENTPFGAMASLITGDPCTHTIESIEETEYVYCPYKQLLEFYQRHSCWQEMGRKIAEGRFISKEKREYELLMLSAEERFEAFKKEFPALLGRVTKKDIASYLGINNATLSRLLKKIQ
jgi:CRP-like cAMP-binding protein